MQKCNYGCGNDGIYFFKTSKKWCCSKSPNSCEGKRKKDSLKKKGKDPFEGKEHPRGMAGKRPWNKGLSKETNAILIEVSLKFKGRDFGFTKGSTHTDTFKKEQSTRLKERYAAGWEPVCGRCKKYDYSSIYAGDVKVDGTWELSLAKYLDNHMINWRRNKKRFVYLKPNGVESTYQPDFYLVDVGVYIEVKGYQTDLDNAKWKQFKDKLIVLKKSIIDDIKNNINIKLIDKCNNIIAGNVGIYN